MDSYYLWIFAFPDRLFRYNIFLDIVIRDLKCLRISHAVSPKIIKKALKNFGKRFEKVRKFTEDFMGILVQVNW